MIIPLYVFLIIYIVWVFICLVLAFFSIYHAVKFGFLDITTVFMSFLFLAVFALIIFISYKHISVIDWQEPVQFFGKIDIEVPGIDSIPGL